MASITSSEERLNAAVSSTTLVLSDCAPAPAYDTAQLYRSYSRKVFAWAKRLVHSSSDAEDVVQEVFLTVHRRQETLGALESPRAWLLKVTMNVVRHMWRKRGHSIKEVEFEDRSVPSEAPSPLDHLEAGRAVRHFVAALASLDQRSQEIYWLCEIQQLPSAVVAARTGVHPATLRVRRFRARAQLAQRVALDESAAVATVEPTGVIGGKGNPRRQRASPPARRLAAAA